MNNNETAFIGTVSVKAVLENRKRKASELIVDPKKRSRDIAYCIAIAKQADVPVHFSDSASMREEFGKGHGGIVLVAEENLLPDLESTGNPEGFIAYISGVEDPFNMGSVCRTLYAAGVSLMIIQNRSWSGSQNVLMRSSAGAWDRMNICTISTEDELIAWCRKHHLPIYCAFRNKAENIFSVNFPENFVMVIGGAMRGISAHVLENADQNIFIPYGREFRNALDTPSAAAVIAFAWTAKHPWAAEGE